MSIIFEHSEEEVCHKDVDFAMIVSQGNPVHIDYKEKDFIGDDYYTKPEIDILVKDFKTAEQIRNENELRRIQFEINREYDEDFRQANEIVRIENEDIRIENEKNRQSTFEILESQATELIDRGTIVINEAEDATDSANEAAEYAILKANEAVSKWQLCGDEPDLPVELWFDCSDDAASLDIYAVEAIGKQAKIDGDYARVQGDYAKELGDKVAGLTQDVEGSVKVVAELIDISIETLTDANAATEGARQSSVEALESANMAKLEATRAANSAELALSSANVAMENSQSAQTAATAANTSAQAAESAASSAISAANQANTQAAFAQTQGQFSLQSGKFAEEAGAYAKEQATTIDEKISGKADLYNYYPYEGEVRNGFYNSNGDFVSNSSYRAAEFDCSQMESVYMTMGYNSVANRCVFLSGGIVIHNKVALKTVNYRWIVPEGADTCRISTETANIDSLNIEKESYDVVYSNKNGDFTMKRNSHFNNTLQTFNLKKIGDIPLGFTYGVSIPSTSYSTKLPTSILLHEDLFIKPTSDGIGMQIGMNNNIIATINLSYGNIVNGLVWFIFDRIKKEIRIHTNINKYDPYVAPFDNDDFYAQMSIRQLDTSISNNVNSYVYGVFLYKGVVEFPYINFIKPNNTPYVSPRLLGITKGLEYFSYNGDIINVNNTLKKETITNDFTIYTKSNNTTYWGIGSDTAGAYCSFKMRLNNDVNLTPYRDSNIIICGNGEAAKRISSTNPYEYKSGEWVEVFFDSNNQTIDHAIFKDALILSGEEVHIKDLYISREPFKLIVNSCNCSSKTLYCDINGVVKKASGELVAYNDIDNIITTSTSAPTAAAVFAGRLYFNANDAYIAMNSCLTAPTVWKKITP